MENVANVPAWVYKHAFELWLCHIAIMFVAGLIPPLPPGAGFWAQWAYGIMKGLAVNMRGVSNVLGFKVPELQLSRSKTNQGEPTE